MATNFSYRVLAAAAALAGFAGCAHIALPPINQGESAADVRRAAGPPSQEQTLPDGTKAWFYVNGPAGWTTYRVLFSPEGTVLDSRQVLTGQSFRQYVVPGKSTREQVGQALGPPGLVMRFPNLREEVWTYRWVDSTIWMRTDVHFDASTGVVRSYNAYWDPCPHGTLECMGT
jgi:hypothetical protein